MRFYVFVKCASSSIAKDFELTLISDLASYVTEKPNCIAHIFWESCAKIYGTTLDKLISDLYRTLPSAFK